MNISLYNAVNIGKQRNDAIWWGVRDKDGLVYSRVLVSGRNSLQETDSGLNMCCILQGLRLNKSERISGSSVANSAPSEFAFSQRWHNTQKIILQCWQWYKISKLQMVITDELSNDTMLLQLRCKMNRRVKGRHAVIQEKKKKRKQS